MTALTDWVMWILGGFAAILTPLVGVMKRNRDRSLKNERRLIGDPDDPNAEGVLPIAHETRERVSVLEEKIDTARRERKHEHEAVMDRIGDLDQSND